MDQTIERPVVGSVSKFVSPTPWHDSEPDCLVLSCSDHRFEQQVRDLARFLGYLHPHVVQFPSGPALTLPMATAFGFLSKAADKIVERVIDMKHLKKVVLVGHEGCGAYKTAGHHSLLDTIAKLVAKKPVKEVQMDHLRQAAKRILNGVPSVVVQTYLAEVVDGKVRFSEVK